MSGVLVVAEHRRGEARDITFELIGAALELKAAGAGPVFVAVIGAGAGSLAKKIRTEGVDEVLAIQAPNEEFEPHVTQRAVELLIDELEPSVILTGHTVDGSGFAPALAAANELGFAANVLRVEFDDGSITAYRGTYADRLVAELSFSRSPVVLMVRFGSYRSPAEASATVRRVALDVGEPVAIHTGFRELESGDVDIAGSEFLLSVGGGIKQQQQFEQMSELAERLGATLSVSRPVVDAGWAARGRLVGQSGHTVKPKVYLAMGISGAAQHLNGVRDAETIIAVNTDSQAPIFDVAQYAAVVDMFDLATALTESISVGDGH